MPMYEYRCLDCEEEFEELVRSVDEEVECPECDSESVQRKMSTFAMKTGGRTVADLPPPSRGGGGKCGGCAGGNCATC